MKEHIIINEVGLRDGLQNQPNIVSTGDKARLLDALINAGIQHFEPVSFVHPKLVPAMADANAFTQRLPQDSSLQYTALVPNLKGYDMARQAGYKSIAVVISTTDNFNQRNLKMSLQQAKDSTRSILAAARQDGIPIRTYLSGALDCPYDGFIAPSNTLQLAEDMLAAGSTDIAIADTTGGGHPTQMQALLSGLLGLVDAARVSLHLHDTRGMATTLAWIGCQMGIRRFDASIGGLGGCPFAPGATGNVATEDLVYLFESAGFDTGIDIDRLKPAVAIAREATQNTSLGGNILRYMESREKAGKPCQLF